MTEGLPRISVSELGSVCAGGGRQVEMALRFLSANEQVKLETGVHDWPTAYPLPVTERTRGMGGSGDTLSHGNVALLFQSGALRFSTDPKTQQEIARFCVRHNFPREQLQHNVHFYDNE